MDNCLECAKPFRRKYPRGKRRKLYCSKACRFRAEFITLQCKTCGKTFRRSRIHRAKYSDEYCSARCIQRGPCELCGLPVSGRIVNKPKNGLPLRWFCSRRCAAIANTTLTGEKNYTIKGFAITICRLGILACEKCRRKDVRTLVVHHKDRNHKNNDPDNLQTLCANCHFRVHWRDSKKRAANADLARLLAMVWQKTYNRPEIENDASNQKLLI